jgi:hypothetical protein
MVRTTKSQFPRGLTAVGVFLFFGATMACLAGITLLWPGTVFTRVWALNAAAYKQLAPLGWKAGISFLLLSAALATAGVGWFRRLRLGWGLAVLIIAIQVAGDLFNLVRGDFLRGGTGFVIAGGLFIYLLRPNVRACFEKRIAEDRTTRDSGRAQSFEE